MRKREETPHATFVAGYARFNNAAEQSGDRPMSVGIAERRLVFSVARERRHTRLHQAPDMQLSAARVYAQRTRDHAQIDQRNRKDPPVFGVAAEPGEFPGSPPSGRTTAIDGGDAKCLCPASQNEAC